MYDYLDKFKGQDGRNSVYQILSETTFGNWETIKTEYDASDIAYIKIDGNTFSNYGQYQFIWEKTFVKSPERSAGGSIGNLNSYATFLTPHLIINFSIMSIDDYRAMMKMHYEKNEFTVECYDFIYNKKIKVKMYFATEEMAKLYTINKIRQRGNGEWEDWIELVGVQDYSVELIGTNNDLDLVSVVYKVNAPEGKTPDFAQDGGEEDVYNGEEVVIGANTNIPDETFGGTYKFKNWNLSPNPQENNKGVYINGNVYTITAGENQNALVLYAQWQSTEEHTLTYNYGLADPAINDSEYVYINNISVAKGKTIGKLPTVSPPKVKYKDLDGKEQERTDVYHSPQWWKIPQKAKKIDENGNDITSELIVQDDELYWADRDSTIYLLYETTKYALVLYLLDPITTAFEEYQANLVSQGNGIAYNSPMNLPQLVKSGYTFDGWYHTPNFQNGTKISENMPPYDLRLYARWIKK